MMIVCGQEQRTMAAITYFWQGVHNVFADAAISDLLKFELGNWINAHGSDISECENKG